MVANSIIQIPFYCMILLLLVKPLGWYMARVYKGQTCGLSYIEQGIYKICSIVPNKEMNWKDYLVSMLIFNLLGFMLTYLILRLQFYLPLNPQQFPAPPPDLAFNTAISFITNTDWQAYSGETTLSYFSQMLGLSVQNFISAASGMSLLIALIRGITRHESHGLGNFWVDTVRGILYILLPLSLLLALLLCSQGVIQNFNSYKTVSLLHPYTSQQTTITEQLIPMGPVASQVAIKQLGSNGGGFFNTNSAHPYENPTPLSNFLEMLAIMLIPAAFCYTFGLMVNDIRQGWVILSAMFLLFIPALVVTVISEQAGNPALNGLEIDYSIKIDSYPSGNMEGKETRFGIVNSALWATATTATANGSVNTMLDSFTPLGALMSLWPMHLGEVSFGGVGSGLYSMLMFIIITVFVVGLMVGRSPEYLGKKIEPFEMKMASVAVLVMPLIVLVSTAIASVSPWGTSALGNPGAHGFTEIVYAFTSMGNNNGSSFAGLNANTPFYNILGGIVMLFGRYWIAIPALAIAGSLVKKKQIPVSSGTLQTHTPLFIAILVCVTIIIGALAFLPAMSLGPIVEQLMIWGTYVQ